MHRRSYEPEIHDIALANDLGVFPYFSLAWLLSHPGIVAPIASASRIGQLQGLLDAASLTLTADELQSLTDVSDKVGE